MWKVVLFLVTLHVKKGMFSLCELKGHSYVSGMPVKGLEPLL